METSRIVGKQLLERVCGCCGFVIVIRGSWKAGCFPRVSFLLPILRLTILSIISFTVT